MLDNYPPAATLTPKQMQNRRMRNIAIGLCVGFVALLLYFITFAKGLAILQSPG